MTTIECIAEEEDSMQPEIMNGTQAQVVGKFTLYIKPDSSLIAMTGNQHMQLTADEACGLLDYLLQYAQYFEQASNGHVFNTEPLRIEQTRLERP